MNYQFSKGSVVLVNLGKPPTEVKGHEQAYQRPAIVIQHFTALRLAVIVPCTSKTKLENYYTTVKLSAGLGGLPKDSIVLCHQIRTISVGRIMREALGQLPPKEFYKIQNCLLDILRLHK